MIARMWNIAVGAVALVLAGLSPALAEYRLQPGDQMQVAVAGLPQLTIDAFIDNEGDLDLAWIGLIDATGRTINDVEAEVRGRAQGQILRQYNTEGQVFTISLEANRLDLRLVGYRPVVIAGDVATNGQVPFTPSLTVREAVALSGGSRSLELDLATSIDPIRVIDWQNALNEAIVARADARMRIWRTTAELAEDWESTPPNLASGALPARVVDTIAAEQTAILSASQAKSELEQAHYTASDLQAARRIEILREQQGQQSLALEFDKEEELRTRDLVERGLAPGTRLTDVRRALVATSTQLLDIEEALTAAELFRLRLKRDTSNESNARRLKVLDDKRDAEADLRQAESQLSVLAQFLGAAGVEVQDTTVPKPDYVATIYRKTPEGIETLVATKDTLLEPGDLVEVESVLPPVDSSF